MTIQFPDTLTPELDEILGTMIMDTTRIAHLFRETGEKIPEKTEREHAFVVFWMLRLALEHGPEWRKVAAKELAARLERAKAQRSAVAFPADKGGRPVLTEAERLVLRLMTDKDPFKTDHDTTVERVLVNLGLVERCSPGPGEAMIKITSLGRTWLQTEPREV